VANDEGTVQVRDALQQCLHGHIKFDILPGLKNWLALTKYDFKDYLDSFYRVLVANLTCDPNAEDVKTRLGGISAKHRCIVLVELHPTHMMFSYSIQALKRVGRTYHGIRKPLALDS
jgi:hypothetical protein